jgi:hypothetical protein
VRKVYKNSSEKNESKIYIRNQIISMTTTTNQNQSGKKKPMILRDIPSDVKKIILQEQGKKKADCECQFSMEQTIYMLIRRAVKKDVK